MLEYPTTRRWRILTNDGDPNLRVSPMYHSPPSIRHPKLDGTSERTKIGNYKQNTELKARTEINKVCRSNLKEGHGIVLDVVASGFGILHVLKAMAAFYRFLYESYDYHMVHVLWSILHGPYQNGPNRYYSPATT